MFQRSRRISQFLNLVSRKLENPEIEGEISLVALRQTLTQMMESQLPQKHHCTELSPSQIFYLDNKDALLQRAEELLLNQPRSEIDDLEEDWVFYRDPVVRPNKGFLWTYGESKEEREEMNKEVEFEPGVLPSPLELVDFLNREQVTETNIIDLNLCGRRDIAGSMIIGTIQNPKHAKMVGEKITAKVNSLKIPNVTCLCPMSGNDQWVTAQLGSIVLHLLTAEARASYNIEALIVEPHNWLQAKDFPHYNDHWQNSAPPEFVTRRGGPAAPVYDDSAREAYSKTDY